MIGIDEVGRGCWAGPLVVAAVRLNSPIEGLKDSKKISRGKRLELFNEIEENADVALSVISSVEIDQIGLALAVKRAFIEAYQQIKNINEPVIVDGNINYLGDIDPVNTRCEIGADNIYPEVSAASIYAKVYRDDYMKKLSAKYQRYGFDEHVGYGTKAHLEALKIYGPINGVHRFSYKPIKKLSGLG
jgi:ribonuclease HII